MEPVIDNRYPEIRIIQNATYPGKYTHEPRTFGALPFVRVSFTIITHKGRNRKISYDKVLAMKKVNKRVEY